MGVLFISFSSLFCLLFTLQLCQTEAGRLHVKANNACIILRELLAWETCQENIESIRDVQDLLVDEEPQEALEEIPPGWYSGTAVMD